MSYDPNQARDARGRWSPGGAGGDHQASQSKAVEPGRQPITSHNGAPSVGTHYLKAHGLSTAAQERINILKGVDERHTPTRTDADVAETTDFGSAAQRGRFNARGMKVPTPEGAAEFERTRAAMKAPRYRS